MTNARLSPSTVSRKEQERDHHFSNAVRDTAIKARCRRLWLLTANDNLSALRFYQKWGLHIVAVYPNALEKSRRLKPEIPLLGREGIPLRDEIELEMTL